MILLDMEMPENCFDCRFRTDTGECELAGLYTSYQAFTMPLSESCPIKAEIPKNATNGDVIKAMFPQAIFTDSMVEGYVCTIECHLIGRDTKTMYFDADWWNAPWKG